MTFLKQWVKARMERKEDGMRRNETLLHEGEEVVRDGGGNDTDDEHLAWRGVEVERQI